MNIYTVHDAAAAYFLPPFCARSDAQARRMFIASLGDSFPHRKDFVLFNIGTFDDENGTVTGSQPTSVLAGFSIDASLDPRVAQPGKENS